MPDLAIVDARLTAALAGRYRIEREIGAGGMATMFFAEHVMRRRRVALEMLHPELSAVPFSPSPLVTPDTRS